MNPCTRLFWPAISARIAGGTSTCETSIEKLVSPSRFACHAAIAFAGAVVSIGKIAEAKEAEHAVVILTGDQSVSAADVGVAVKRLGSMMDNQNVDVEYGVRYAGSSQLQVSLLASGFKSTKYDDYDPLAKILGGKTLDDDMDVSLTDGLALIQPCD